MSTQMIIERKTFDKESVQGVLDDDRINVGFELEFDTEQDEPEREEPEDDEDGDSGWFDDEPVEQLNIDEVAELLYDINIYPAVHHSPNYKPDNKVQDEEDDLPYPMRLNEIGLDELDQQFEPLSSEFYGGNDVDVYDRLRKLFHALYPESEQDLTSDFKGNRNSAQDIFSYLVDQFGLVALATSLQMYPTAGWYGPDFKYGKDGQDKKQDSLAMKMMSLDITDDDAVNNYVRDLGKVTGVYDVTWEPEEDDGEATVDDVYQEWVLTSDSSIGHYGYELVSPVLPLPDCLKQMSQLFAWIDNNGFKTTNKCGFHVSMSYGSKKMTQKADFLKLGILLDEQSILEQWGRVNNEYTLPQINHIKKMISEELKNNVRSRGLDAVIETMKGMFKYDKYTAINVSKFNAHGYFEFRIMGGAGYHNEIDKVRKTVLKYAICLKAALDPDAFRKEYLVKLYKILDKQTPTTAERTKEITADLLAKGFHTVAENPDHVVDLYKQFKEDAEKYKKDHDPEARLRAAMTIIDMMVFGTGQRKAGGVR